MDKKKIAEILSQMAILLELKGENQFKVRAYVNGARIIETLTQDVKELVLSGEIKNIKGIGKTLADNIIELVNTGDLKAYHELKTSIPEGLLDLVRIPSLGPKKVYRLYKELEITNVTELEYACLENRLIELKGFGKKTQDNILKGIEHLKKFRGMFHYVDGINAGNLILEGLKKCPHIKKVSIAGSLRRTKEVIKDVDIVASSESPLKVMDYFVSLPEVKDVVSKGNTKSSVTLESGINVDLRVVSEDEYVYALHHFTGSKEHNTALRHLAKERGLKINEYGIYKDDEKIIVKDEEEFFKYLGLQYIPPELRENMGEIESALKGELPKLITDEDIEGVFHVHTKYSDGVNTIEELVSEAKRLGYKYLGISDHSRTAVYANGLSIDRLKKQQEEINEFNLHNSDFYVFHGIESDILPDGSLDYPDEILKSLDFVIGSIHSGLNMDPDKATERILNAMENPYLTMLGHPTGRILLGRKGYEPDMIKIIKRAWEKNIILELNASPYRLDIDWRHLKFLKEKKVKISINPDAHRKEDLSQTNLGVKISRKGFIEKEDVFNSWSVNKIKDFFKSKK